MPITAAAAFVGRENFDTTGEFNGSLDEYALWSRALNATEASQLYDGGAGNRP